MSKRHQAPRGRQTRHDSDDDAFIAGVLRFGNWAKANQTALIVFGLALVVIVWGVVYYVGVQERNAQQAALELEQIQQTVAVGNTDAAKAELSLFIEQFGDTPYAGEAALLLGELYLSSDQPDLAMMALDDAGIRPDDPLGPQVLQLRARAEEMLGNLDRAEELYLTLAENANMSFERRGALGDAARMREMQGDWAGAASLYDQILATLEENDPERGRIEMRRAEAATRAG